MLENIFLEISYYIERSSLLFSLIAIFAFLHLVSSVIVDQQNWSFFRGNKFLMYSYWAMVLFVTFYLFENYFTTELAQKVNSFMSPVGILLAIMSLKNPNLDFKFKKRLDIIFLFLFLSLSTSIFLPSPPKINGNPPPILTDNQRVINNLKELETQYIGYIADTQIGKFSAILEIQNINENKNTSDFYYKLTVTTDHNMYIQDGNGVISWNMQNLFFTNDSINCEIKTRNNKILLLSNPNKKYSNTWFFEEVQ